MPKRRWFRFSLRALFIATTLFAVVLGRVIYLHREAEFHDREYRRLISSITEQQRKGGYDDTDEDAQRVVDRLLAGDQSLEVSRVPPGLYYIPVFVFRSKGEVRIEEIVRAIVADEMRQAIYQRKVARDYGRAVYRPWSMVDDQPQQWASPSD